MNDTSKPGETPTPTEQSMQPGASAPEAANDTSNEAAEVSASDASAGEISVAQLRSMVEALQIDLDKKTAELSEKQDQLLRALAETENVRRRLEKEKSETAKFAIQKFAKDMLTIGDNFQRAITSVSAEAADKDPTLKSLIDGVTLAERDYRGALQRHGVVVVDPAGELFNPHHHQAVMEQENADVPSGTVMQVFQVGYLINERCLRPAMVAVSRGGPKAAKPSETNAPVESDASEPAAEESPNASQATSDGSDQATANDASVNDNETGGETTAGTEDRQQSGGSA